MWNKWLHITNKLNSWRKRWKTEFSCKSVNICSQLKRNWNFMEKNSAMLHIFRVRIVSNFGEKQMSGKIQASRVQWRTHRKHRIQYKEFMWPRSRTRATLPWLFIVQTFIYWITFKSDMWTLYTEGKIRASVCMFDISTGPRRDRMNLIWKVNFFKQDAQTWTKMELGTIVVKKRHQSRSLAQRKTRYFPDVSWTQAKSACMEALLLGSGFYKSERKNWRIAG